MPYTKCKNLRHCVCVKRTLPSCSVIAQILFKERPLTKRTEACIHRSAFKARRSALCQCWFALRWPFNRQLVLEKLRKKRCCERGPLCSTNQEVHSQVRTECVRSAVLTDQRQIECSFNLAWLSTAQLPVRLRARIGKRLGQNVVQQSLRDFSLKSSS